MLGYIYRRSNFICITAQTSFGTMLTKEKRKPSCKVWLEHEGEPILGRDGADILKVVEKEGAICKAAKDAGACA
jgi:hypothetical protein